MSEGRSAAENAEKAEPAPAGEPSVVVDAALYSQLESSAEFARLLAEVERNPEQFRLAAALVRTGLALSQVETAAECLSRGIARVRGPIQRKLLWLLVRLQRLSGDENGARMVLSEALEDNADDFRSRRLFHALLEKQRQWTLFEQSSARAIVVSVDQPRWFAHFASERADLLLNVFNQPHESARLFAEAARAHHTRGAADECLKAHLLALEALFQAKSSPTEQDEAFHAALAVAQPLFREHEVLELVVGLRVRHSTQLEVPTAIDLHPNGALPPPDETKLAFPAQAAASLLHEVTLPRNGEPTPDEDLPWNTEATPLPRATVPLAGAPAQSDAPALLAGQMLNTERKLLYAEVRANPLRAEGYLQLAENFDATGDPTRSSLMLEIARALAGDPHAAPVSPRLILSGASRIRLRHPSLKGSTGELFDLAGQLFCTLYAAKPSKPPLIEFSLEAGKWAKEAANALLSAVRILGIRAPRVMLSEQPGPPFSALYARGPMLLVSSASLKQELAPAELRFFAGRALIQLEPALMCLRSVGRTQLAQAMPVLRSAVEGPAQSAEARVFQSGLSPEAQTRVWELFRNQKKPFDFVNLADSARHSMNRAGLLVAGGISPALEALRAKRATDAEMIQLIRFAASERYLQLRERMVPVL